MKATELINRLTYLVDCYGDVEVAFNCGSYANCPIENEKWVDYEPECEIEDRTTPAIVIGKYHE